MIFFFILITYLVDIVLIAALAERSPIIIQRPYDRRPYDRTTVRCYLNMHGQLYATALFSSPVVSALGLESDDLGSIGTACVVLLRRAGKKMRAPLLGLAKSIYYCKEKFCLVHTWEIKG